METIPENYNWAHQGSMGCGDPSPYGYICSTAPTSMAQGTSWKRGWKGCQSQNMRISAVCLSVCTNKAWTISKDRLMGKWGISQGLSPTQKKLQTTNNCLERKSSPLPGMSLLIGYPIRSSQLWNHIYDFINLSIWQHGVWRWEKHGRLEGREGSEKVTEL